MKSKGGGGRCLHSLTIDMMALSMRFIGPFVDHKDAIFSIRDLGKDRTALTR